MEEICVEALEELDADVLTEALDIIDGMELLSEDYYDSAVKASKEASKTPAAKAGRANLRKEKMKAALKSAGSAVKKGLKTAGKAAAKGAGYAAGATVRAAKAGASEFKKVTTVVVKDLLRSLSLRLLFLVTPPVLVLVLAVDQVSPVYVSVIESSLVSRKLSVVLPVQCPVVLETWQDACPKSVIPGVKKWEWTNET